MKKILIILLVITIFIVIGIALVGYFFSSDRHHGSENQIGLVNIKGVIIDARETVTQLGKMAEDPAIKGIIIRINSPGGAVAPSQEIYDEIKRVAKTKPVFSSLGTVAASGGYYVACGSPQIYANPGTLTGSIGVIMEFTNWKKVLDKIGIGNEVIKSGTHKDIGSPLRTMSAEEKALLQEMIDDVYNQFVGAVSKSRDIPMDKLLTLADGRVFSGRQALEYGLVDKLGSLHQAIRDLAQKAGITGKPEIVEKKEKRGLLWYILGERLSSKLNSVLDCETPMAAYLMPMAD